MNVGQPVIMQAANSEAQELTEDVMDDADVAGLAMTSSLMSSISSDRIYSALSFSFFYSKWWQGYFFHS